jgi:hypothetical protein
MDNLTCEVPQLRKDAVALDIQDSLVVDMNDIMVSRELAYVVVP